MPHFGWRVRCRSTLGEHLTTGDADIAQAVQVAEVVMFGVAVAISHRALASAVWTAGEPLLSTCQRIVRHAVFLPRYEQHRTKAPTVHHAGEFGAVVDFEQADAM